MKLPPSLWVTYCRAAPASWWKGLSSCPTWISQAVNVAVAPHYILSRHFITSVASLQIWCRLLLDPHSPKWTTPAHNAPMLWSRDEKTDQYQSGSTDISPHQAGNFTLFWLRWLNFHTAIDFMAWTGHNFFMMFYHSFTPAQAFQMHKNIKCQFVGFCPQRKLTWQRWVCSTTSKL